MKNICHSLRSMFMSVLMMVVLLTVCMATTSCETFKETFDSLGVTDKIKAAAREWINKKIDELGEPKESPELVVEADQIDDAALKAEVLSQLKAPVTYKVAPAQ